MLYTAGGGEALLCPVCRGAHLVQRHGILVCPREGWQLNLAAESLRVSDVQQRLAQAYQARGCVVYVPGACAAWPCWATPLTAALPCACCLLLTCCITPLQEHGTSGCTGQLAFHIEALFGSPSLTASCERCHTLAVVL